MFERNVDMLSPVWWEMVKPTAYPVMGAAAIRIGMDSLSSFDQIAPVSLPNDAVGSDMFTCTVVPVADAPNAAILLGDEAAVEDSVLGTEVSAAWKWYVAGLPEGIVGIGKGPNTLKLRGIDFKRYGSGYLFLTDPRTAGTLTIVDNAVYAVLLCVGGSLRVKHRVTDRMYYLDATDRGARAAIARTVWTSSAPLGVEGSVYSNIRGIRPATKKGVVTHAWEENGYLYAVTDKGEMVSAPAEHGGTLTVGDSVLPGDLAPTAPSRFAFPLGGTYYIAVGEQLAVTDYPGILEEYGLTASGGSVATVDLYSAVVSRGCMVGEVYGDVEPNAQRALERYSVPDGQLLIQQNVDCRATLFKQPSAIPAPEFRCLWDAVVRVQYIN